MFFNTSFTFAGEESESKYGLKMVRLNGGMIEQILSGERKIIETTNQQWDKPIFHGTSRSPFSFTLTLAKEGEWTFQERLDIIEWLFRDEYVDFRPQDYPVIMKTMAIGQPSFYNNGYDEGYLEVEFRTDSGHFYTPKTEFTVDLTSNPIEGTVIQVNNDSNIRKGYKPEIEVTTSSTDNSFTIKNLSNGTEISMNSLNNNETIYIDCDRRIVLSDTNGSRLDKLVDLEFLELSKGVNDIEVKGEVVITIRTQYPMVL